MDLKICSNLRVGGRSAAAYTFPMSTILLGAVVAEFLTLRASGRVAPVYAVPGRNGHVEFCGSEEVGSLTVVAPGGNALFVRSVGTRERMVEIYEAEVAQGHFWDEKPNRVVVGGRERTFRPLGGQLVIGVFESGDLSVILCQVSGRVGIVTYEGGLPALVFVCAEGNAFGVVDIDTHRLLTQRARPSRHQMAAPAPCDTELSQLIARALHDLATRASTVERPAVEAGCERWASRRVGKRDVGRFADLLIGLGARGCGDLYGPRGVICAQINTYFPGRVVVTPKKLTQVLGLMLRTGTCLIERPDYRNWLIRIGELRRPGSPLLKRFLAEYPSTSALSLPSSASFEGVVVRPRANSPLGRLHDKLTAARPPPPNSGSDELRETLAASAPASTAPLNDDLLAKLAAAARPAPPSPPTPPPLNADLLEKLAAAARPSPGKKPK